MEPIDCEIVTPAETPVRVEFGKLAGLALDTDRERHQADMDALFSLPVSRRPVKPHEERW